MALDTATVTLNLKDKIGGTFRVDRTSVRVITSADVVIDTEGDEIRLGSGSATIDANGTATVDVWIPGEGSNPAEWQTTFLVDVPDPTTRSGRRPMTFGPFTITADANLADLVAEMPVQPEYASDVLDRLDALEADSGTGEALAELGDRLDGVNDHGNVTGTLTIDPEFGYHVFDATGPTEVTLGTPPGNSVAFKAITGADDVTVDGLADLVLTDDQWATFVYYRDAWHLASAGASGGGTVEPVIDPPTQPGAITVDPTSDGYNLSWVASTVAAGYEVQIDGGSWVDSGANLTHAYTGLTAGSSHSGNVRAYNSVGERSTARAWGPTSVDTMTLHDLILSMEPEVYVRLTEGAIEDHSRVTGTWNAYTGYGGPGTLPTFDGPPLSASDTSSAHWVAGAKIERTADGLMTGATSLTQFLVSGMLPGATGGGGGRGICHGLKTMSGGQTGTEGYEVHQPGGVHSWFSIWNPAGFGDSNLRRYIEGNSGEHSIVGGPGDSPLAAPEARLDSSPGKLMLGANEFAGVPGSDGGYQSVLVVWKRVLTVDERVALATAAGTIGNPAGGTLT